MYIVVAFATTINTELVLSSVSLCVQDIEHVIVYKIDMKSSRKGILRSRQGHVLCLPQYCLSPVTVLGLVTQV